MRMLNPLTLISCMILSSNCYTMHYPGYVPLGQVLYPRGVYIDQTWCVAAPCPTPSPIVIDLPGEDGFTCPGNGLFPDPQSGCKAYYNCNEGQAWRYNCPPSLKFDASIGSCNWGQNVDDGCNASK